MPVRDHRNWMLSEALAALERAERMHRQFFHLEAPENSRSPLWEPPIDMFETEREIIILVALPGVDPEKVDASVENGTLVISGRRILPEKLRQAMIHRLELPQGRFARRLQLPPGRYVIERHALDGCLLFNLQKMD